MENMQLKDCALDTCARCENVVGLENTFTISGLKGKYFLVPFCEPCVDIVLAEENAKFDQEKKEK